MPSADLIIANARVMTMDPARPAAEAVAVRAGRLIAVGTSAEIAAHRGPNTRVIDAGGKSVLPGINESHIHIFLGSTELTQLSLFEKYGYDTIRAEIQAYAGAHPGEPVIFANAADYTILGTDKSLDRHVLDSILPDRPLVLTSPDHHTVWVNTPALKKAGLLHGRDLPPGNEIVMGADGLATGELREHFAFDDVMDLNPTAGRDRLGLSTGDEPVGGTTPAQREADKSVLRLGLKHMARHGITSFQNMDGNRYTLELLAEIEAEGGLLCRARVPSHYVSGDIGNRMDKALAMSRDFASEWLSSGTVKFFIDGVLDNHTAVMADGYADRPDGKGEPRFDEATFKSLCIEADKRGLQIAVHSIGDGATRIVLDAYAAARVANGPRDSRHRIEHLELVRDADFQRLKDLDVVASMQPPHPPGQCGLPLEPTLARIGREHLARAYAWRRIRDLGVPLILSTDWPVSSVNPWASIHSAMTRKPWHAGLPDNRQTFAEAVELHTSLGAYAEFAEGWKGKLKAGYAADLVMLDRDAQAAAPDEIAGTMPVLTICGGRVTFEARAA